MNDSPKAVFLSYASQDAKAARLICDALRAEGLDVWFDQSALRGGDVWDASIRKQIRECALFVPVISANTQSREEGYFRLEWKLAVDRSHLMADDKAFLVPVVIDDTASAHARVPEKFKEVQWTHLPAGDPTTVFSATVRRLLAGGNLSPLRLAGRVLSSETDTIAIGGDDPSSIAVVPFVNRSHDEDDEYFSDGLADEILNVLTKIRGLKVAARSSAFTFKGKGASAAEVGRTLNVATVLEGSVRKAGNRMRISVQLVNVADGYHLWSETYDRTLDDIFAVQDDIAKSVVNELRSMLAGERTDAMTGKDVTAAVAAAATGRATNVEAHRLYLLARHLLTRLAHDDTEKAIAYLKEAIALDPEFALAWVELAAAHANAADRGWVPVSDGYARAREAVALALALEPDLAEGHAQLGWIQFAHDWDWRGAEASLRRALELAPGNARVLRRRGSLAFSQARLEESISFFRASLNQDPLGAAAYNNLGVAFYVIGRLPEAEAAFRKALEISPQLPLLGMSLALTLLARGRSDEALTQAMQDPEEWGRLFALAIIHQAAGRRAESDAALNELIMNHAAESAYQIASVFAARGDADPAFAWLERANNQRDAGLAEMKPEPLLRPLHSDPRWPMFLRRMGLAD